MSQTIIRVQYYVSSMFDNTQNASKYFDCPKEAYYYALDLQKDAIQTKCLYKIDIKRVTTSSSLYATISEYLPKMYFFYEDEHAKCEYDLVCRHRDNSVVKKEHIMNEPPLDSIQ